MSTRESFSHVFGEALRGTPCAVAGLDLHEQALPVQQWMQAATPSDHHLLGHCRGITMDVGCGPGRMSVHLAERRHDVVGVDVVREAVDQARRRGVTALHRNVFDPMPGEGHWDTVLLADGNIGIGGDPVALLRRSVELLGDDGRVVCDLAAPGTGLRVSDARLVSPGMRSARFRWAQVGPDAIGHVARASGLRLDTVRDHHGRWFAVLRR